MCQDAAQISFHITVTKGSQKKTQRAPLTAAAMKNMDYERGRLISIYHCRRPIQRWRHQTYHHQSAGVAAPASPRGTRTRDIAHAPGFFFPLLLRDPLFWDSSASDTQNSNVQAARRTLDMEELTGRAGIASAPTVTWPKSERPPRHRRVLQRRWARHISAISTENDVNM